MEDELDWLPPLVLFKDYGGDWGGYLEAVYQYFEKDFVSNKPSFQGRRLGLKKHPLTDGKEATFWHFIQEGKDEAERTPDLRRCERICWPKPIIENDESVKVWLNERRGETRVCLWHEKAEYLVILADRGKYILPWTAYPVMQSHRKRKLQKEYDEYLKKIREGKS